MNTVRTTTVEHGWPRKQMIEYATLTPEDKAQIAQCRGTHNRLGFAYQIAFARLTNRFPAQQPLEIIQEVLDFVGVQLGIDVSQIEQYAERRQTVSEQQIRIQDYLKKKRLDSERLGQLQHFLFEQSCRLERTEALQHQASLFLKEHDILEPAPSSLRRIIGEQRRQARQYLYQKATEALPAAVIERLDGLLEVEDGKVSELQILKEPPGIPSAGAVINLTDKLRTIEATGVLVLDLSWLHNNYQRTLTRYVRGCSAHRLRELEHSHRYTAVACFLRQTYQDTVDQLIDMYDKLINRVHNRAQNDVDEFMRQKRRLIQDSLSMLQELTQIILDEEVGDTELREMLFSKIPQETLASQAAKIQIAVSGKKQYRFSGILRRFQYLRKFSPTLLKCLEFEEETVKGSSILEAVELLKEANAQNKRILPAEVPTDFVPAELLPFIEQNGTINKRAWECVLLTRLRDEIKSGNVSIAHSKRFGRFDNFLIPHNQWDDTREYFFQRAGLPSQAEEACVYLSARLNQAYENFLASQPKNSYAKVDENGWRLSSDPTETLDPDKEDQLEQLKNWLSQRMRSIRLPDLLIEVDNDLHFTNDFVMPTEKRVLERKRQTEDICAILVTIMAHGCNVGPYTMSRLTQGVSYEQIKRITDWQLTEEAQRSALSIVVQAVANLDSSKIWGQGKTSSSDGQRFSLPRKILQQTYSTRFRDFALEFYSFVADNYAPFYSIPIECTNRDAAYVLDGLLYNETDLPLEEHYTDTHGYTEINFAAFAMFGRRFCPRIRGIHHQHIYCIDREKDYGILNPMVNNSDHTIKLHWIRDHWERMGHFYASLETGYTTASVALKRLTSASKKNQFYRANRELGRIFKTEFILQYLSQPGLRRRIREGILKGEQLHALAREVFYGKRGRMHTGDLYRQMNTCSCLTLILACIVYWQAKEIGRVLSEGLPEEIDTSLVTHVSPVEWDNVLLYGEYVIDRNLIQ